MHHSRTLRTTLAVCAALAVSTTLALAQSVSVTLNGAPVSLDPQPQERAGRVFVPLRGVFERLGASVVYADGQINAQGNGHSVSLHIGSNQATVDGGSQLLDVAPFIIGASTYVPLRFVSQALGASVNYDASNRIVALATNGGPPPQQVMQAPPRREPPPQDSLALRSVQPGRDADVQSRRPTIEAQFGGADADPNSLHVTLDGLNITDQSSRSPHGVVYSPPSDLQAGRHTVVISGHDANGQPFEARWNFVSGQVAVNNTISDLRPGDGAAVPRHFNVSGRTMPGAHVIVQVGTAQSNGQSVRDIAGQILGVNGGSSVRSEVVADGNGNFSAPISIDAGDGQPLTLVVDSTDARTQASAPRVVRQLTIQ